MKKILPILILILSSLSASAFEDYNLVLKKNDSYMMFIDDRPVKIQVSDPNIIKVQYTSDLYNRNFQILLKTYSKGKTDVLVSTAAGNQYTMKIKVEENPVISNEVIVIDMPPEI
jgi:uncharacterized protein YxeA